MKNKPNKIQGFTLIELMITLSIAIILTAIGIPSFSGLINSSRMTANANDLLTSLNYARSEAITRNIRVYVGKIGGADKEWEGGWNIFIDLNSNHKYDIGDELLKTHEKLASGFTLRTGGTYKLWMAYEPSGLSKGSGGLANDRFHLCDADATIPTMREIVINRVGKARVRFPDDGASPSPTCKL